MTTPKEPPKESLRARTTRRLSTDKRGRLIDAEARHDRNVSWVFYGLIVVIVVVIVGGLLYGFWESNLKPIANVDGTDVSRSQLEDRKKLKDFRAARLDAQTRAALAAGDIETGLASTLLSRAQAMAATDDGAVAEELVKLIFEEQLAADEGVELTPDELDAAVAADGTISESRQVDAVFVLTTEQEAGQAATDQGIADAHERALLVAQGLADGGDPAELVDTYGPASTDSAWITAEADLGSPEWAAAIYAADEGSVAEIVQAPTGEQLVARVNQIVPAMPDPGFLEAVNDKVGESVHRRNVELETLAGKLEQTITDDALAAEYEQVQLGQIFIERNPVTTDDSAGEAHASHILYAPETPLDAEGNPTAVADLPADDPAWDAAEAEAQATVDELSAIEDPDERAAAFAEKAKTDSDGPTGPTGGDLGWFPQEGVMVSEFTDAIWGNVDAQPGDVLGPVRTEFGWHVILFQGFRSSLDARVRDVEKALAADGADFETVEAEYSEDPAAADGPVSDWSVVDQLDENLATALEGMEVGDVTEAIDEGDGYHFYQPQDEAVRPLDEEDAALVRQNAFSDWYDLHYYAAQDEGRISIDDSVYQS
jgi:PPIC-type PPIASE domain